MIKRILLICSSIDETIRMHEIANQLSDCDCRFMPYPHQELSGWFTEHGLAHKLSTTRRMREVCLNYLNTNRLPIDTSDGACDYDVVVSTPELAILKAKRRGRLVLIQNAMLDHEMVEDGKENASDQFAHWIPILSRWLTGVSSGATDDSYDKLCVASEGYRDLFVRNGVDPYRIVVTGIPKFDNYASFLHSDFSYRDYALVVTSEERDAFHFESHRHFVRDALRIARGWELVFLISASESHPRTIEEIQQLAPAARLFTEGEVGPMVANCGMLITQCPSVAFIGMALGKELHSHMNLAKVYGLLPLQNGGQSASNIAQVCRNLLPAIPAFEQVPPIGNRLLLPSYSV